MTHEKNDLIGWNDILHGNHHPEVDFEKMKYPEIQDRSSFNATATSRQMTRDEKVEFLKGIAEEGGPHGVAQYQKWSEVVGENQVQHLAGYRDGAGNYHEGLKPAFRDFDFNSIHYPEGTILSENAKTDFLKRIAEKGGPDAVIRYQQEHPATNSTMNSIHSGQAEEIARMLAERGSTPDSPLSASSTVSPVAPHPNFVAPSAERQL